MPPIISIKNLSKKYDTGTHALRDVSLDIREGEIFALLGPNGAGKTTLIGATTGIVTYTSGTITVLGKDVIKDYRFTRSVIGLVPQEIHLDIFLSVEQVLQNQRGFYGKPKNPQLLERIMKQLSLWEKRHDQTRFLSGGMKRRVLIAKALTNEPKILFLDEPTAGVDVELRKDMWRIVEALKQAGTTIILTTHYIEEAELLADRIGIINNGELMLVEEKETLMRRMSEKTLLLQLEKPIQNIPPSFDRFHLIRSEDGMELRYQYSTEKSEAAQLIVQCMNTGLPIRDLSTTATSLEEIFVTLIGNGTKR